MFVAPCKQGINLAFNQRHIKEVPSSLSVSFRQHALRKFKCYINVSAGLTCHQWLQRILYPHEASTPITLTSKKFYTKQSIQIHKTENCFLHPILHVHQKHLQFGSCRNYTLSRLPRDFPC